ncbi:MAG TPA: hypothetical protein VGH87_06860, partial [Polyangiaceae bacterium]
MMVDATEKKQSRFREWRTRVSDRLARSSRVFLLGVIVACGIEVITDSSATLNEITNIRANVRHKGENYVAILGKPSQAALRARDGAELARLSDGLWGDDDAAVLRYYDEHGKIVYERTSQSYAPVFDAHKATYDHLMNRDVAGMLGDRAAYKARVANSRYRDFAQIWTDTTHRLSALVSKPPPPPTRLDAVLWQDRLRDENHARDDKTTWAIGVVDNGVVLVAFDMRATNDAIRGKYIKGLGIVAFFVGLIVVQNILARRDKLRLLDLQTRYAGAKKALRDALPLAPLERDGFRIAGALDQAKGPVDGMAWSYAEIGKRVVVLVVDPDGDGIDAAAVGLHMVKTFKARAESKTIASLDEEVAALGAATADIPLTRPIGIAIASIDLETGVWEARLTAFGQIRALGAAAPAPVAVKDVPDGIVGPIASCSGTLERGTSLLVFCAGLGVVAFFVGLIVVQNILARRDKLRLLDLQTRYAGAKKALREA